MHSAVRRVLRLPATAMPSEVGVGISPFGVIVRIGGGAVATSGAPALGGVPVDASAPGVGWGGWVSDAAAGGAVSVDGDPLDVATDGHSYDAPAGQSISSIQGRGARTVSGAVA
ncbi:MAG: hypothetical protein DCC72_04660 [Burkholderiales bacterium]|nr:MAG: hypothetical protein DCC72_04660 [Burkholderiales bacterium]